MECRSTAHGGQVFLLEHVTPAWRMQAPYKASPLLLLIHKCFKFKIEKHSFVGLYKVSALAFTPSHTEESRDPVTEDVTFVALTTWH